VTDLGAGREIERRFLVGSQAWRAEASTSSEVAQVYLATGAGSHVRVRLAGGEASVTVKGAASGITRVEIESAVAPEFFHAVVAAGLHVGAVVMKVRHLVRVQDMLFEVDEYHGANAGLVTAEVELDDEGSRFPRPPWLGAEISGDRQYGNLYLARHPFGSWAQVTQDTQTKMES
jgi:adenylate cyclase